MTQIRIISSRPHIQMRNIPFSLLFKTSGAERRHYSSHSWKSALMTWGSTCSSWLRAHWQLTLNRRPHPSLAPSPANLFMRLNTRSLSATLISDGGVRDLWRLVTCPNALKGTRQINPRTQNKSISKAGAVRSSSNGPDTETRRRLYLRATSTDVHKLRNR